MPTIREPQLNALRADETRLQELLGLVSPALRERVNLVLAKIRSRIAQLENEAENSAAISGHSRVRLLAASPAARVPQPWQAVPLAVVCPMCGAHLDIYVEDVEAAQEPSPDRFDTARLELQAALARVCSGDAITHEGQTVVVG